MQILASASGNPQVGEIALAQSQLQFSVISPETEDSQWLYFFNVGASSISINLYEFLNQTGVFSITPGYANPGAFCDADNPCGATLHCQQASCSPIVLNRGNYISLLLRFVPIAAGTVQDTLRIHYFSNAAQTIDVNLTGSQ